MADEPQELLAESEIGGDHEVPDQPAGPNLEDVHKRALNRFDSVAVPQQDMRAQSLAARRFVTIPGAQWEGDWGEAFENAPRPEIDKITPSLEKIETDYRENRMMVNFVPVEDSDADTAETLNGMYRADADHFKAQQAKDNGFQEAIRGGFGAYRLTTDYADPYDDDDDSQRVNPGLVIVDADQRVYFDPASKLYDKSDADWGFVLSADPRATAIEKWGEDNMQPFSAPKMWDTTWDWFTVDTVLTAEYYEIEDAGDRILIFTNKLTQEEQRYYASELDDGQQSALKAEGWAQRSRKAKRRRVHKYILNGAKVLKDCGYIAGRDIPVVPIYGRRDFVDGMERWRGHVSKLMDRQRVYNSGVAKVVETNGMSPARTPILYSEEISQELGDEWARRNIDRLPFLRRLPMFGPDGQLVATQIQYLDPPDVPPAAVAALQLSNQDLTENDDSADQVKSNVSADAMDIAAGRVDSKSAIYIDNMRQSEQRGAEIYRGMGREVYFEPGRKVDTLTVDGKDGTAELSQQVLGEDGVYKVRNDLTQGKYKVVADVQESTATKRQKTVRQSLELANAFTAAQAMQDALPALYTAAMNMDGEGIQDLQDFYRNRSITVGATKPTAEEQKQIDQAKEEQGQQPPSAQDQALQAAAAEAESKAGLNKASAIDKLASAHLKGAQAEAVGGPEAAPEVPSGLDHAHGTADVVAKLAGADLKTAQAAHLRHDMGVKDRAQDHTERTAGE